MLQYIRERAQGFLAWVIVSLIIVTFALWGIQEYLGADSDLPVAEVNGTAISKQQLAEQLNRQRQRLQQTFGANYRPEMFSDAALQGPLLENLIERELTVQAAEKSGLAVTDVQLANIIRTIPVFQENGQFSPATYERVLRMQGYSPKSFEAELRRDLLVSQLQSSVQDSAFVTPLEAQKYLHLKNQVRDVGVMTIAASTFAPKVAISDAEVQEHYDANRSLYVVPEQVRVAYVELAVMKLMEAVQPTEEQVRTYYETHLDDFRSPEERKARHILFRVGGEATTEQEQAARAKADETLAKVRAGGDFAALAKELSEDPGSAREGGDLGYFPRGVMDGTFEQVAFELEKGHVSEPVRSAFGYHLIRVEDVRGGEAKTLAEVRAEISARLREDAARDRFYELADTIGNLAYEHPDTLNPVAEQLGLSIQTSEYFPRGGARGVLANEKVQNAIFGSEVLERGANSEPIEISSDHLIVVRVADRKPETQKTLDEVRGSIMAQLRSQKAEAEARVAAERVLTELSAGGDPAAYAKRQGYSWQRQESNRTESNLAPQVRQTAFRLPRPEGKPALQAVPVNGDQAVVAVFAVKDGSGDAQTVTRELAQSNGAAIYDGVIETLRKQASVKINRDRI